MNDINREQSERGYKEIKDIMSKKERDIFGHWGFDIKESDEKDYRDKGKRDYRD